jgi:methyl-accepting chemotaxis protein
MKIKAKFIFTYSAIVVLTLVVAGTGIVATIDADSSEIKHLYIAVLIGVTIIAAILSLIFAVRLIHTVVKPLQIISKTLKKISETGDFITSQDARDSVRKAAAQKDELADLANALSVMMDALREKIYALRILAQGDLTQTVPLVASEDTLGVVVNDVVSNLNSMVREVKISAEQLSLGINQLASASQALAQSTAEQSATVEELFAAVNDISAKADENEKRAGEATSLAEGIRENVDAGSEQMLRMTKAMDEINSASKSIESVMKVIDEITFQTNILSLNAAVEAARAGQQGKGFAVVAEEVRNLATRSAAAASDSNQLIENTLTKSSLGASIVKETSDSLKTILDGVASSTAVINKIAESSTEQNSAIDDINQGINQLTSVVYQNSATAEESAAATDEMQSQIATMLSMVYRFNVGDDTSQLEVDVEQEPEPIIYDYEPSPTPDAGVGSFADSVAYEKPSEPDSVSEALYGSDSPVVVPTAKIDTVVNHAISHDEDAFIPDDESKY